MLITGKWLLENKDICSLFRFSLLVILINVTLYLSDFFKHKLEESPIF